MPGDTSHLYGPLVGPFLFRYDSLAWDVPRETLENLRMAASDKSASVPSLNDLSAEDRLVVVSALELKAASVLRAQRAESNPAVAQIRGQEYAALQSLAARFR